MRSASLLELPGDWWVEALVVAPVAEGRPSIVTVISPRHSAAVRTEMRRCIADIRLLVAEIEVQHRLHAEVWGTDG